MLWNHRKVWDATYTQPVMRRALPAWGQAVGACHELDDARSIARSSAPDLGDRELASKTDNSNSCFHAASTPSCQMQLAAFEERNWAPIRGSGRKPTPA
jgi:hypothetical protein